MQAKYRAGEKVLLCGQEMEVRSVEKRDSWFSYDLKWDRERPAILGVPELFIKGVNNES